MSRKEKLLIADDDAEIRALLLELLKTRFDNIEVCENGKEACDMLKEQNYDLVLTDIMMPFVDGMGVLKEAKALYGDIIVLMMTGRATLDSAIESVNLGADGYITKPFNIRQILDTIDSHLERQGLKRENIRLQRQVEIDRDQLKKNLVEIAILYNFSKNLTYNFDIVEVYNNILESLSAAVENDFCSIYSLKRNQFTIKTSVKLDKNILHWLKTSVSEYMNKECDKSVNLDEMTFDINDDKNLKNVKEEVGTTFNFFLRVDNVDFGVLNVNRFSAKEFSENDKQFLAKLAEQSAEVFTQLRKVVESQKDKMERIIEDMPDGVIMYDRDEDSILYNFAADIIISDAGISSINKHELESLFEIRFEDFYNEIGKSDKTLIKELKLTGKNNKSIVLDAHVACLSDPDGMPQGVLMVLRDVTKEREIERLKSEFLSNVSHELRTPSSILKEFTSILKDEIAGPITESQSEYLQIMSNNIDRLLRLIDNLLNMSRMEANMLRLRKTKFKPDIVLRNIVKGMNVRYEKSDMRIEEEIQDDMPEIYADPDALTQIVINCLDNSLKFSEQGSKVILRSEIKNSDIYIEIQDFGKGIPKKDLNKIFSRFYRVENKDEVRKEGSGLGLSIVKEFVNLHKGTIKVESELNKGTTFFITIPINSDEELSEVKDGQENIDHR
ncbi:response regulator [candidate division KSB1 bacterium]|nr:response regulator [candidate division KSB1 bacterium]